MRRICTLTLLLFVGLSLSAQSIDEQKKEINRVKKNFSQYIYVEVIDSQEDVALTKARHYLQDEIDEYVSNTKKLRSAHSVVALNVKEQTVSKLLGLKVFSELETNLPQLQTEKKIGHYAKFKHLGEPEKYVLVIYNRDDEEVVDRLWPLREGYMLRQIPLIINPQEAGFNNGTYQEASVLMNKQGQIIEFSFVFDNQLSESMERCNTTNASASNLQTRCQNSTPPIRKLRKTRPKRKRPKMQGV